MDPTPLLQASVHRTEQLLFFSLLQLAVIVVCARAAGNLAVRWGNARAVGEIMVGILLGPSLFGLLWPAGFELVFRSAPPEPLTILSQIGLVLLLFQIGLEFDFAHLRLAQHRRTVVYVALAGELLPFALGFAFGAVSAPILFPHGNAFAYSLFCGTALAITALPILGRIMLELDLHRSAVGVIAISAAAIDDVVGWLLLAVVSALAVVHFSAAAFAVKLGLLALYVAVCVLVVRPLLLQVIRRFGVSESTLPLDLMGILLAAVFLSGMITYAIGIFAIFGGIHPRRAAARPAHPGTGLAREGGALRERVLRPDLLHLHRAAHRRRAARRLGDVGLAGAGRRARHAGQAGGLLRGSAAERDRPALRTGHRDHDEHAGADGAGGHQRGLRPQGHPAERVHHAGAHGNREHGDHDACAQALVAGQAGRRARARPAGMTTGRSLSIICDLEPSRARVHSLPAGL